MTTTKRTPALKVHFGRKVLALPRGHAARVAKLHATLAASFPKLAPKPEQASALALALGAVLLEGGAELYRQFISLHPELEPMATEFGPRVTFVKTMARLGEYAASPEIMRGLVRESWIHDFVPTAIQILQTPSAPPATEPSCSPAPDAPPSS